VTDLFASENKILGGRQRESHFISYDLWAVRGGKVTTSTIDAFRRRGSKEQSSVESLLDPHSAGNVDDFCMSY